MEKVYLLRYQVSYASDTKMKVFKTFETAKEFVHGYKHHKLENAYIESFEILVEEVYDENFKQRFHKLDNLRSVQKEIISMYNLECMKCNGNFETNNPVSDMICPSCEYKEDIVK